MAPHEAGARDDRLSRGARPRACDMHARVIGNQADGRYQAAEEHVEENPFEEGVTLRRRAGRQRAVHGPEEHGVHGQEQEQVHERGDRADRDVGGKRAPSGGPEGAQPHPPAGLEPVQEAAPQQRPQQPEGRHRDHQDQRPRRSVQQRAEVVEGRGKADDRRREGRGESRRVLAELHPPFPVDLARSKIDRGLGGQRLLDLQPDDQAERRGHGEREHCDARHQTRRAHHHPEAAEERGGGAAHRLTSLLMRVRNRSPWRPAATESIAGPFSPRWDPRAAATFGYCSSGRRRAQGRPRGRRWRPLHVRH